MRAVAALALVLAGTAARAQTEVFVTGNVLAQRPATGTGTQNASGQVREETATLSSAQTFGTSPAYDMGAGIVNGGPRWKAGFGVAVSRTQQRATALVSLSWPHPILFDRTATATSTSGNALERRETATHLQAVVENQTGPVTSRLFAGPSYVRLARTLVSDVRIQETLDLSPALNYAVAIAGIETTRAAESAWGYHIGGDVGVIISRHVGAGAMVRYTRATASVPNGLQRVIDGRADATSQERLGGVSLGAGIRLRF
jgi:hypothetical protein